MLQILFIDKLGQVSTEMLAVLDIVLRKVRNFNIYLGGLLIDTSDHTQIPPVKENPFMASPHILTSFEFVTLQYLLRVSGDPSYQHLQNIAHPHPRK